MKGVILAGGTGSRLYPLTKVTNKHLLPVFNKPMVYYPLLMLKEASVKDVLIVSGRGHCGSFLELLGSGASFGMNLTYEIQEDAGGIAQALSLAEGFVGDDKLVVVLGDNVIEDNIGEAVRTFESGNEEAHIFLKSVANPKAYGVAELGADSKLQRIVEKPQEPVSDLAVVGLYMYDPMVFNLVKNLQPSARNELEITDVNNMFLERGKLGYSLLKGFWGDCGESFEGLLDVGIAVKTSRLA